MTSELVIDVRENEISIALLEDKSLVEYQTEPRSASFSVGNVYIAKVKKLMPGLNASFVDVGYGRDAFLHYLDLGNQFSSYEKYLKAISENEHVTQTTMFPVQMQVGAASVLLVESNADLLSGLGYDISSFGTDTIVVRGVPEGCSCETGKVEALVREVLGILDECHTLLPELMRTKLAEGLASSEAAGAAPLTSPVEARHLIDTLFTCEMTDRTASGAPILSIITEGELENKLK